MNGVHSIFIPTFTAISSIEKRLTLTGLNILARGYSSLIHPLDVLGRANPWRYVVGGLTTALYIIGRLEKIGILVKILEEVGRLLDSRLGYEYYVLDWAELTT